jgi:hypothetical protein
MAGSGSSAISQARIEVLDETGARETKSRGVLGIGRLIFGWHLPFHVAQIRDARALDGKLIKLKGLRSIVVSSSVLAPAT